MWDALSQLLFSLLLLDSIQNGGDVGCIAAIIVLIAVVAKFCKKAFWPHGTPMWIVEAIFVI